MAFGSVERVPIRTYKVPQTTETPVTFVSAPGAYVRYAYSRSSDSMANHIEGQDYLCFQHNDQRLVFVVADGVGSSFCGNLAARIVGDGLLEWLWSLDILYVGGADALSEAAVSFLNRLQKQAQREVEEYEIPGQMSPLIKQALEGQRAYGSEAIFAAARVDYPSPSVPQGLLSIFWMGDTQIHALDEQGQELSLGGVWDNANRWSTARGVRGKLCAWMRELNGVGRITAFSDGLSAHAAHLLAYSDDKLNREIVVGARLPTSDDVAFIDVVIRSPLYEGYLNPQQPDLNAERPHLEQIWNPTGADQYEIRWSWPGQPKARFIVQQADNPALTNAQVFEVPVDQLNWRPPAPQSPGVYYYRVRAVNRQGVVSPWSELRQTRVAYPPPPAPSLQASQPGQAPALGWSEIEEALEYVLEQSPDPDFSQPEIVYSGRGTSWSPPVRGYRPGLYYYRVRAISDGGPGAWSESAVLELTLPPPPQTHLAAVVYGYEHGSYELRWQAVSGATRYELEEINDETGESRLITLSGTTYQVTRQPVGTYIYRVRACHEFACGEWSGEEVAVVAPLPPEEAPELSLEGPDESDSIRLCWTEVEGAERYTLEESVTPAFEAARFHTVEGLELDLPHREAGETYFRVCGTNQGGDGPWSNTVRLVIIPKAPAWIEVAPSADHRRVMAAWGAVSVRAAYCLQVSTKPAERADFREVYHGADTQFEMDMPDAEEEIVFRVRAELPGASSEWTVSDPIQVGPPLPAPRLEIPRVEADGAIRLVWNKDERATHYVVEVANNEQFNGKRDFEIEGAKVNESGVNFRPPTSGLYWFRVHARRGRQISPPSNAVSAQAVRPAAPRLLPIEPVQAGALYELAWTGVQGCAYYELQESDSDHFDPDRTRQWRVFHPSQKFTIKGRPAGRYFYRVKSVDENEQASVWSNVLMVEVSQKPVRD